MSNFLGTCKVRWGARFWHSHKRSGHAGLLLPPARSSPKQAGVKKGSSWYLCCSVQSPGTCARHHVRFKVMVFCSWWVEELSHIALSWVMCTGKMFLYSAWQCVTTVDGAGAVNGFWVLDCTRCQGEPPPSVVGGYYFLQPPLFCTVPVPMSGRWLQSGLLASRAEQTGQRKDLCQGSSQLRRRVLCRCAASPVQLGSLMLVVAFLVLRRKRLTAVLLACPKQFPSSCISYCCCGHFGWAQPFLFLPASAGVLWKV